MRKKYVVRLSEQEQTELEEFLKGGQGSVQKRRRANILLGVDENGRDWPDAQVAEAYHCSENTVKNTRKRFVEEGLKTAINGKMSGNVGRPKKLSGDEEAELIALRLGEPPEGYSSWSLRLLAEKAIQLEVVESVSYESVRRTLKKRIH